MTAVSCKNLNKTFTQGDQTIKGLDNVTISIEAGEFVCLSGPSGSGKTTLLNLIAGIDSPTSGDLDGESAASILQLLRSLCSEHGKTIVMVTHDPRAAEAADRTLHLEKGKLLENAERELRKSKSNPASR